MQTVRKNGFKITSAVKREIINIIDARIREVHVTKEDFSELKDIVKDLGVKMGDLAVAQKELTEAQKRTEVKIEELTEAQKQTEVEIKNLTRSVDGVMKEVGGIGRSAGYALENEAYRHLPEFLQRKYGIAVREKMIRAHIGGKEVNLLGWAEREGREVLVVGEAKTRLDERGEGAEEAFDELEEKVQAAMSEYRPVEIVKILVTHFARKGFLDLAKEKGIIVVQSFEW